MNAREKARDHQVLSSDNKGPVSHLNGCTGCAALDSILTELAGAEERAEKAIEAGGVMLLHAAELTDRITEAEKRAAKFFKLRNNELMDSQARIQTLEAALREVADGEFDDLDPDDGLHGTSARRVARQALAEDEA